MSDEKEVGSILKSILAATPAALDWIERLCKEERAKRVEEIRPEGAGHLADAIEDMKRGAR